MNFFNKMAEKFLTANRRLKKWQRVVSVLAAVVVFVTTYALVLPAITLDKETASTQAGMEIAASEQEPGSDGTVYEAEPEEEPDEVQAESGEAEPQAESASEDSGSQEAEVSEDSEDQSGESEDADSGQDTTETAETVEEVQLITEKTQLSYQYIDENFETDPDDNVDDGYTVYAEFDADAKLPVGVELRVKEITKESDPEAYKAYYEKTLSEMQDKYDENTDLSFARFYDISFVYNGEEIEPSGYVKVRIEYNKPVEVKTDENVDAVHFDKYNDEKPEVIDSEIDSGKKGSEETVKTVQFESDQFSVYGVVASYTVVFNAEVITASGSTYLVTVSYGEDAKIPEGAELIVNEITEKDKAYTDIKQEINDGLEEGKEKIPSNPVLFDISLFKDGQEIEPAEGSEVFVEIKFVGNSVKGMYTDEDSPVLINSLPVSDKKSSMDKQVQVLHLTQEDQIDVMETQDTITEKEIVSSFKTDSFSNWLVYLDEDLTSIDVTTGDSITLRPYTEWVWKQEDEPTEYLGGQWDFPTSDWDSYTQSENNVTYTYYRHKTNGSVFRSYSKTDDQLNETYTVVTSESLSAGTFDIQTNKGKTIHVNVTQGSSTGKPDTVSGLPNLTVNLFDYDVPSNYWTGGYDFTKSGNLDSSGNTAANPTNETVNVGHDLKFLGWGASNSGESWAWINNYTQDDPNQEIVKSELGDNGFPVLNNGSDQNLGYLFDTGSHSQSVYAFPNAGGLFLQDNQGYYYYNSNVNYAEYDRNSEQFVLYEHTYSQNTGGSNGPNAKPIGFFPFHEYDTDNQQQTMNHNQNLNHHFGLSMEVDFEIPKDRKAAAPDGYKHDIIYEFSGDDDLWVFVDDELALDIGGIHQPVTGSINFTTGEIIVHGVEGKTMSFDVGSHTLKMFYIERGGCDSNLSVRFNLPLTIGSGNVAIAKKSKTDDSANPDTYLPGAEFGIWDNANCEGEPYTVATSNRDGLIFKNLPIREVGQKYYLQEINPPEGYLLDKTIYTLTADGTDAEGNYKFKLSIGDQDIEEMDYSDIFDYPIPIIRNQLHAPITISVKKSWENADGTPLEDIPEDAVAKFSVKRNRTYTTDPVIMVILKSDNSSIPDFDTVTANAGDILTIRYQHAPDSSGTVAHCSTSSGVEDVLTLPTNSEGSKISVTYTIDPSHAVNGIIEIIVPEWFTSLCNGSNYQNGQNPLFESIERTSHTAVTEPDSSFEGEIVLNAQKEWTGSLEDLTVQEKIDGIIYHYEYYLEEKEIPEGFEVIYTDAEGNPIAGSTSQPVSGTTTQSVINRKLLDVPIEKHWADFSGDAYDWKATFQLEQMEVKVNESDPDAEDAITEFTAIEGKVLTIMKDQDPKPLFTDLPMYRIHSNGTKYRIQYSVSEIAYTVSRNGEIVAQWSEDDSLVVIGDTRYEPQYEQDAGEHGDEIDDYVIKIVNVMKDRVLSKEIDLDIEKQWPEGSTYADSDDTYAKFVLKRYVHEEHRDYSHESVDTEWVTITLETWQNDPDRLQAVTVPKDTVIHIVGNIKPSTNANQIRFTQSTGQDDITLIQDNHDNTPMPFDITFVADQSKKITLAQGDNYVIGGRDGFRLSDTYGDRTTDHEDTSFSEEFILNKANGWSASFDYLPQIEEQSIDPTTGSQTVYVFSYYLEETESNPADFTPVFKDSTGLIIGGEDNRIDYSTELTAENKQLTTDVTLKKVPVDQLDEDNPKTLKGAAFRIEKYTSNTYQQKDTSWGTNGDMNLTDVDDDGIFSIEGLNTGFYKIVETAYPEGYIKLSEDPIFEVRYDSTTGELKVILLNADKTDAQDNQTEMVHVKELTILFGNEPGSVLPNAGGPGTSLFMILGLIMIAGSGVLLWKRRCLYTSK